MKVFIFSGLVGLIAVIVGGMLLASSDFSKVSNKLSMLNNLDIQVDESEDKANITFKIGNPNETDSEPEQLEASADTSANEASENMADGSTNSKVGKKYKNINIKTQGKGDEDASVVIQGATDTGFEVSVSRKKDKVTEHEFVFEDSAINTINISGVTADIEISGSSDAEHFKVQLECQKGSEKICQNIIRSSGETLSIDIKNVPQFKKLSKHLRSIEIEFPERSSKKLMLNVGAGNIEIEEAIFSSVDLNLGAGNIFMDEVSLKDLKIKNGAGRIALEDMDISGQIIISNGTGGVDIEVLNPDPRIQVKAGTGSISVVSKSKVKDYKVMANTGMGSVKLPNAGKTEGAYTVFGSGKGHIDLKSGVGSIIIR